MTDTTANDEFVGGKDSGYSGFLYFDDNGITWSYLPNELAVEAVGEPRIFIPYGQLASSQCDNSIIERLK